MAGPRFFFDDYQMDRNLKWNENQKRNQVRLVNVKDDDIVIKGFTLSESYNIGVQHDFKQLNGFGTIGTVKDFINKTRETTAKVTGAIQGISSGFSLLANKYLDSGKFQDIVNDVSSVVNNAGAFIQSYAQGSIDSSDAYMYVFDGTDITIPTRFTQYLITDAFNTDIEAQLIKIFNSLIGEFSNDDAGFIGYTKAPNGFETSIEGLSGKAPRGTFTMWYGDYRFPGVVVNSIDIDVSKTRVSVEGGKTKPLYIQIDYGVKPVIKYTKKHLLEWFNNKTED